MQSRIHALLIAITATTFAMGCDDVPDMPNMEGDPAPAEEPERNAFDSVEEAKEALLAGNGELIFQHDSLFNTQSRETEETNADVRRLGMRVELNVDGVLESARQIKIVEITGEGQWTINRQILGRLYPNNEYRAPRADREILSAVVVSIGNGEHLAEVVWRPEFYTNIGGEHLLRLMPDGEIEPINLPERNGTTAGDLWIASNANQTFVMTAWRAYTPQAEWVLYRLVNGELIEEWPVARLNVDGEEYSTQRATLAVTPEGVPHVIAELSVDGENRLYWRLNPETGAPLGEAQIGPMSRTHQPASTAFGLPMIHYGPWGRANELTACTTTWHPPFNEGVDPAWITDCLEFVTPFGEAVAFSGFTFDDDGLAIARYREAFWAMNVMTGESAQHPLPEDFDHVTQREIEIAGVPHRCEVTRYLEPQYMGEGVGLLELRRVQCWDQNPQDAFAFSGLLLQPPEAMPW